jgi:hypothetical protein
MSVTIDYLFNSSLDLTALADEINRWIGCSLSPFQGDKGDLFCRFLGMELSLQEHSLENDRELNFEDYTYIISFRTPIPDADLRGMQVPTMVFIAYAMYARMGIAGMLVYDAQILLAKYELRLNLTTNSEGLYDSVSGDFVRLSDHLEKVRGRIPSWEY